MVKGEKINTLEGLRRNQKGETMVSYHHCDSCEKEFEWESPICEECIDEEFNRVNNKQ